MKRRFFFHYNRPNDKWSLHYKGKCHIVEHINCQCPTESHKQKHQPRRIVRGFSSGITIKDGVATIS